MEMYVITNYITHMTYNIIKNTKIYQDKYL